MSYTSARAKYKAVTGSNQETSTKTTSTKLQQPTKYSEQIVRFGRRGQPGSEEIVTRKYQVPTKVTETKTRYDPSTGTTQKTTTIGYKPEQKVVKEVRRYGTPTNAQQTTTTTTSRYQPSTKVVTESKAYGTPFSAQKTTTTVSKFPPSAKIVTEVRKRCGTPTASNAKENTTSTSTKFQQPTKYSEQIVRFGRRGQPGSEEIVTRKYQVPTKVTETKTKYDPSTGTTQKTTTIGYKPEQKVVKEVRRYGTPTNAQQTTTTTTSRVNPPIKLTTKKTRYDGLSCSKGVSFGTEGLPLPEPKTRFGAQPRGRGKGNDGFVVSEKRSEKYSNENGKEQKVVTVEKTTADGTKRREVRRFCGTK